MASELSEYSEHSDEDWDHSDRNMKLSILIVNWNTRDLVIKCIHSILQNPPDFEYEIIVVDNGSQDGSVDALVTLFGGSRKIRVLQSLHNLGFAKANNWAYQESLGEYIFLLNPDTEVREGALSKMVEYLEEHPKVAVLGPKLVNPDGTTQASIRRFPGIWSSVLVFSGLHRFIRPHKYLMDDFSYEEIAEVDQVMGAAFLTRRSVIASLGFLDEIFWLWYEEVDFCKRIKSAGYQIKFFPKAVVMHSSGQSFSQIGVFERKKAVAKSLIYYFQKNGNIFEVCLIGIIIPLILILAKILDYFQKFLGFKIKPHS